MKEMDENRLRGWRPRRASAGLKRKIFGAENATPLPAWDFSRLAPAMACLLFALLTLHFNGAGGRGGGAAVYADFSRGSNAVAFSDGAQERENHLAGVTFDWTNAGVFRSSIHSQNGLAPSTNSSN